MTTTASTTTRSSLSLLMLGSALGGAVLYAGVERLLKRKKKNPETDYTVGHDLVWNCIGGAMQSCMLYIGDRLDLYSVLREACGKSPEASMTAVELSQKTGLNQRWLREWLAQQASMGVLLLQPGEGNDDESLHYRLPKATGEVLANPDSKEYDIAMVTAVPSLVARAKTMLPQAFQTGIGRPYDEPEVAQAIDRHHRAHVRDVVLSQLIPLAANGKVMRLLIRGCAVADLGCGGGNLLVALAKRFPNSQFHGYDVSEAALGVAATNVARAKLKNVFLHNAKEQPLKSQVDTYDICTTYDVLHDAPNPTELISQVKASLKPDGVWLLADIPCKPTVRENVAELPKSATYYSFSTCLCLACSLSVEGGEGLGTLGFSIPLATKMLKQGGFENVQVLLEHKNTRWFVVT